MTKTILITVLSLAFLTMAIVSFNKHLPAYDPIKYYDRNGIVTPTTKIFRDTFNVNTSDGFSVNLSAAGFSSVKACHAVAMKNSGTATSVPNISIKTLSTTALVLNITEGNGSLINILGSNVLLGPSTAFASTTGLSVSVTVYGN